MELSRRDFVKTLLASQLTLPFAGQGCSQDGNLVAEARLLSNPQLVAHTLKVIEIEIVVKKKIRREGKILLCMRHATPWSPAQALDPSGRGYVSATSSRGQTLSARGWADLDKEESRQQFARFFPWQNIIQITNTGPNITRNESIKVVYGDMSAGGLGALTQTFSGEALFRIYIDCEGDDNFRQIGNDIRINILPAGPYRVRLTAPSQACVSDSVEAKLHAEDFYGNNTKGEDGTLVAPFLRNVRSDKISSVPDQSGVKRISVVDPLGSYARSNPIVVNAISPDFKLFWGDIHFHSILSDGMANPDECYDFAKSTADLDVCAMTDHDFMLNEAAWERHKDSTNRYYKPGEFVTLNGFEWSGFTDKGGDHNIYFLESDPPIFRCDSYYNPKNANLFHGENRVRHIQHLYQVIESRYKPGEVIIVPHKGGRAANPEWHLENYERLIEVYSEHGRFDSWAAAFFKKGYRLGVIASSDNHFGRPGYGHMWRVPEFTARHEVGMALMGIYAQELTRHSIFEALYSRRVYATTGERIIVQFEINTRPMGSEIVTGSPPVCRVAVFGTEQLTRVELYRSGQLLFVGDAAADSVTFEYTDSTIPENATSTYYVRALQANNEIATSSPIWVNAV